MSEGRETFGSTGQSKTSHKGASQFYMETQDSFSGPRVAATLTAKNPSLKRAQTSALLLRTIEKRQQVVISFDNVCAWVPTLVLPGNDNKLAFFNRCAGKADVEAPKQQTPRERQILFNVSGEVNPGEVLALMGPSGGGKTSLLTLLGGRSTARLEGAITFNGAKMSKPIKRKLGYVMQDDLLFAELTVYETLYYAALLRLPRSWSRSDKLARVELVVEALGLGKCRDTIIGSHSMRGVSGGERKRVSIGHELLINPSMLLLDEPTSGLDSTTALRLMHTLRSLASGGRTIVTSIHQPSSRLYRQMDKLMLLAGGRCMFYGEAQCVATWFKLQGQPCPFGTNIADHILDLANGDVATGSSQSGGDLVGMAALRRRHKGEADEGEPGKAAGEDAEEDGEDDRSDVRGNGIGGAAGLKDTGDGSDEGPSVSEVHMRLIEAFERRTIGRGRGGIRASDLAAAEQLAPTEGGGAAVPTTPAVEDAGDGDNKWGASWVDQVNHLTARSLKTRRFQSLSIQKVLQLLGVAVLSGLFWWQIGANLKGEQALLDIGGLLFFVELFMSFATLYAALFTFPLEFQMLVKERQSGMYRLSAYYLARTASDLPLDCLLPSIFIIIVYWMTGLRIDAGAFFAHWASVILIVLTSQSVGLLIGATVINPQNGQTVATIFMLGTMLVGGYYVRGIPVWISWLKYVSFIYWGWNLLLKIEFRRRPYACELVAGAELRDGGCSVAQTDVFDLDVDGSVVRDVCVLIGMLVALRLAVYYALQYKTNFKSRK